MKILCQTDDWIAVDKPSGVSTHGAWEGDLGVAEWLELHMNLQTHVISRLDKETSGVIIFARHAQASAQAAKIHAETSSSKTYELIVAAPANHHPPRDWECNDPVAGKAASTRFRSLGAVGAVEGKKGRRSLSLFHLQAEIRAGKKHQIRRHAAWSGFPILGDVLYGGQTFPRLCLHCVSVDWPDLPETISSPLHPSMAALSSEMPFATCATLAAADRRWGALDAITDAMRLLHRGEGQGDYAIDRFGECLCVWLYKSADEAACRSEAAILARAFRVQSGVLKRLFRDPHHKGALCETTPLFGNPPETVTVREHELKFIVNLKGNEQTGFFLDQRDNRRRVSQMVQRKRVANLFAYTCSFTAAAARMGPEVIFSIDISRSALREGIRNLQENGLKNPEMCKFVEEDCRSWLERQRRKEPLQPFGIVICDPPTFGKTAGPGKAKTASSGKGKAFRIADEWRSLASNISDLLASDGQALFCCNNRQLTTDFLEKGLRQAFSEVIRHRPPLDFPEEVDPLHNRMFWCQNRGSQPPKV